jgi:capsular polysaccharide biosynthesis protein
MKIQLLLALISILLPLHAIKNPTGFTTSIECLKNKQNSILTLLEENGSKQFVLSLDNGIVFGEGAIITTDGKVLTDTESYKRDQHRLVSKERDISNEQPIFFDGTLAVISSPGQQCYYHWLLQVIPRLKILAESKLSYDKIYLFSGNFKYGWQKESLFAVMNHLGIPQDKLFLIETDSVVQAKTLLVPSIAWKPSSPEFWSVGLSWYKKFFNDVFIKQTKSQTPKRIFISRSKALYRRIRNETDLMNFLSKKGFVAFHLEDLSIYDQAALFNNAEIIIGPHGAGWTNLIFCKPGTKIIEIDHGQRGEQRSSYKGMARRMGCVYNAFYVDLLENTDHPEDILAPINQDMMVDIFAFEQFLEKKELLFNAGFLKK